MTTTLLIATTAVLEADHWRHGPPTFWPVFPILWLLVIGTVVFLVVRNGRRQQLRAGGRAGEARLAERFAAGEIEEEEYRSRLSVLRDH